MTKLYLFQYSILRYFHDPVTQEFLNIGVVVYSKEARFLGSLINRRYGRISKTFSVIDRNHYERMTSSLQNQISRLESRINQPGLFNDFPDSIEQLLIGVLPPDDSSLRFGGFGGGLVEDLESELDRLFYRFVEMYEGTEKSESRRDEQVWHEYARLFAKYDITEHLEPKTIELPTFSVHFSHAYKNEKWHPVEAVSFDLADSTYIRDKAYKWIGRASSLEDTDELGTLYLLLGAPRKPDLRRAYEDAVHMLRDKIEIPLRVVLEEESETFSQEFAEEIKSHLENEE